VQAIHAALTEPHLYLPGLRADMGVNAAQEDAVLAYTLFDQVPGGASPCSMHHRAGSTPADTCAEPEAGPVLVSTLAVDAL
jgi:hypothetical protein